jgi:UDP-GlcNAc:undecaprenyl-phosphate GlcNAc-1-phosphate transferase
MSSLPLWGYGVVLVGSLVLSLVLVPIALAVAVKFGVLDHPGPAKGHTKAVPYLGGAAIVVAFAAVVLVGNAVDPPPSGLPQLAGFLGLGVLLALVGLVDDLRGGLSPWLRLVLEAGAAVAVWAMGSDAHLAGVPGAVDALVSVVWIVGVTNAFNLLDNMDGLSAGTAVIAALSIFGIAVLQQRYLVAALALALAGCAAGFLRANFHPAKIYMGDAGSLFLGFVLAVLLLKLRATAPTRVPVAVILAVPGVALFDTTLVVVSRLAHRRSPFAGGQDHTSHRLVRLGLSVRGAVVTIYGAGVVLGGAALLMYELGSSARIVGIVGLLLAAAVVAVPLARVPVYGERPPPGPAGNTGGESPAAASAEVESPSNSETGTAISGTGQSGGIEFVHRRT